VTKSDWKTIDRSVVYENPWIKVEHHNVLNPAGNPGIYGTVHYKNIAVAILPIDSEGFTYIVGQYRYVLNRYSWEIPEGGCPTGENPLDAAKRELQEETGLVAKTWTPILEMDLSNSVSNERSISFLAQDITRGKAAPEETENLQLRKIRFEALLRMVRDGEIRDSLTVSTVLSAANILG